MVEISVDEFRDKFLAFLKRVQAGETIVIAQAGNRIAEIKPVNSLPTAPRPIGLAKGDFVVPDDFDEPLPGDIRADFER